MPRRIRWDPENGKSLNAYDSATTKNSIYPSPAFHQTLLVLIFFASVVLMLLEVLYLQHIRRKGLHASIYAVEIILDVMIMFDVVRRARKHTCSSYLNNTWNWLDLLTVWIVAVHWIVVIVDPLIQVYSDAWIVLRYSINSARIIYWIIRNVKHYRHEYYKVIPDTAVGDLEWLPVTDLTEEQATNMLFDDDCDPWVPGKKMEPEIRVQQFKAPNAVNASEAEEREKKLQEAERKAKEAAEAERLAEERHINDILGPETDEEGK
mmetsp:Transcript_28578/g.39818  ORF Transcript_28578/g.39818 Transcript_28578/m.39818 type:complete len:264 (-) Transcript_28578:555-1346(-)